MANAYVNVPDTGGRKVDAEELAVGANTVVRTRMQITGTGANDVATVKSTVPDGTEAAVVTRGIAHGGTVYQTTLLDAVTSAPTTSATIDNRTQDRRCVSHTFYITAADSLSATVWPRWSPNGTDWHSLGSDSLGASLSPGVPTVATYYGYYPFLRVHLDYLSASAITVVYIGSSDEGPRGGALDDTLTDGDQVTKLVDFAFNEAEIAYETPASDQGGLIVRNIPSGTQAVSAASLPLPTGAATESTLATRLTESTFTTRTPTVGQKAMAASSPVVIASDQSTVPVSGTVTANAGTGTFTVSGTVTANVGTGTQPVSGTVTANAGTGTFAVSGPLTDAQLRATAVPVSVAAGLDVDVVSMPALPAGTNNIGDVDVVTMPAITGTVTANAGTGTFTVGGTVTANAGTGTMAVSGPLTDAQLRASAVPVSVAAGLDVDVVSLPSLPAGTNNIGDVDVLSLPALPAGTNNIGDVDVLSLPAITGTVTANAGTGVFDVTPASPTAGDYLPVRLTDGSAFYTAGGSSGGLTNTELRAAPVDVEGAGTAGSPSGGVLSIQGVASGTAVPVSGTFFQATQPVSGTVTSNIGTTNGLALDATLTGGTQRSRITDGTNNVVIANGTPALSAYGLVVRDLGAVEPTFQAAALGVANAANKSMIALQNTTGSTSIVKIKELWIVNAKGATIVTGVLATYEMRRCTSFTGGTAITPEKYDTADALPANVTCATGATITGESSVIFDRWQLSTDEYVVGTIDTEWHEKWFSDHFPKWTSDDQKGKSFRLRANEGLTIKCSTADTTGSFDFFLIFTVVAA